MTLQSINGGLWMPLPILGVPPTIQFSSYLLDAAGELFAMVFRVPKTGNIHKIGFRVGAVTASQSLDVGLYTVDTTSGDPTASAYGGMAVGTQAGPAANTAYTVQLGTDAAATIGDVVAVKIGFTLTVGNLNINTIGTTVANTPQWGGTPYNDHFASAAWSKKNDIPCFWLQYDDGTYAYIPGAQPISAINNVTFNSGSASDEYALKFTLPFPAKMRGFGVMTQEGAGSAGNFDVILYDSDASTTAASVIAASPSCAASTVRWSAPNTWRVRWAAPSRRSCRCSRARTSAP